MCNSDMCCISIIKCFVKQLHELLFDYYILSFRCEILFCFIFFSAFLIYPNNNPPLCMARVWRVRFIVDLKRTKRRDVTYQSHSFHASYNHLCFIFGSYSHRSMVIVLEIVESISRNQFSIAVSAYRVTLALQSTFCE